MNEEERGEGCESGGEEDVKGKGDKRTLFELLVCAICMFQFSYMYMHRLNDEIGI